MYKQNTRRVNIKDWFSFTLRSEYIADLIRQKFHGLLVHIYILILPSTAAHKATIQHKTTSLFIFFSDPNFAISYTDTSISKDQLKLFYFIYQYLQFTCNRSMYQCPSVIIQYPLHPVCTTFSLFTGFRQNLK